MSKIRFQIATEDGWLDEQTTFSKGYPEPLGKAITNFKIEADGIIKARVRNKTGEWLEYKTQYEPLGDDTDIIEMEIVGYGYIASVHNMNGEWLNSVATSQYDGNVILGVAFPIDAIWIQSLS